MSSSAEMIEITARSLRVVVCVPGGVFIPYKSPSLLGPDSFPFLRKSITLEKSRNPAVDLLQTSHETYSP